MTKHYLSPLFEPNSIAIFGASERPGSVGSVVTENLLAAKFAGNLYLINPKHKTIHEQPCHRSLKHINDNIDLAVIITPAATVPAIIEQCGEKGIKAAVVISAGFREAGPEGKRLERQVIELARSFNMRFIGPNCLGIMRPDMGFNATFNKGFTNSGNLALVSQSGALCTAILDWANQQDIGFSAVVSMGTSADIGFGEVLDYLVADPKTHSILLYIEGVTNARTFMSGLRAAARVKPVIVIKVGRHQAGSEAAMSHTGSLAGADDVFDAALRRAGVVRGMHIGDLFAAATVLDGQFKIAGENLAIVTNGGGPAAMACDRASDLNIPLAALSKPTVKTLDKALPPMWSHANPIDILGDAGPERYDAALSACIKDDSVNGMLVMLTPQAMTEPTAVAEQVVKSSKGTNKPIITCWMGDAQVAEARKKFIEADIPTFRLPETAIQGYAYLTNFYRNQRLLLQTPGPLETELNPDVEGARLIIEHVLAEKRHVLTELESKAILSAFGIPTTQAILVRTANEALINAEALGFPLAMKIYSKDITHKSDIGGVRLGLSNAAAVQAAFQEMMNNAIEKCPEANIEGVVLQRMHSPPNSRELMIGIISDPIFGPVISFGLGGTAVEIVRDQAMALPPLNSLLIDDLIGRTRAARILQAFRGMPAANITKIKEVLLKISAMACELPWIKELDINPLVVDDHSAVALDARIVVQHKPAQQKHYDHMAIHPYPLHKVSRTTLPNGTHLIIRPIRPEDAELEKAFVRSLSDETKYFRFFQALEELTPQMLARFTQIDYDREMAFVAVVKTNRREEEIGVARYMTNIDQSGCEFAIVVSDQWQHQGIARRLMEKLIECARENGLKYIEGNVMSENKKMQQLAESLGFIIRPSDIDDTSMIKVRKQL